ncbi:sigma-E factor negative regulatory protein [Caenimonas terrae]|uniref:Sigma-E factor negative regulatory protein n=1 Tax=Caenimonas terrae TaxID=696074 RepID=A0ABW0NI71_9BURK
MDKMQMHEMISALADGQLRGEALERTIGLVATDAQARAAWHTYHLIGDVLRSGSLATGTEPAAFLAGFQVRLEREQANPRPEAGAPAPLPAQSQQVVRPRGDAANDGSFRWKLVAGFASLAAVTAIGWTAVGDSMRAQQPQLASARPAAAVASLEHPPAMIRDPRLDELLAAHRQLGGGASALQSPAGFLRNATFEGPAR